MQRKLFIWCEANAYFEKLKNSIIAMGAASTWITAVLASFFLVLSFCSAHAAVDEEPLVDLVVTADQVVAFVGGKQAAAYGLRYDESVVWKEARGKLGAVLTTNHFIVISTSMRSWQVLPLRIGEAENAKPELSAFMALLVTGERAVGFDAGTPGFIQERILPREAFAAMAVDKYVAIVVTSTRALGLSPMASAFQPVSLRLKEIMTDISVSDTKAVVQTGERVLTFTASPAAWHEYRLK